jgi:hypothetical protein
MVASAGGAGGINASFTPLDSLLRLQRVQGVCRSLGGGLYIYLKRSCPIA